MPILKSQLLQFLRLIIMLCKPAGNKAIMAENLALRQQLIVLKRKYNRSPNLKFSDRVAFAIFGALISPARLFKTAIIIKPKTILSFHQALVERKYHKLFSAKKYSKPGPKGPGDELIKLIVEMKQRNPRFGCPRIAMQIQNIFGIEVDKDVVRRVLDKHYKPDPRNNGASWLTFIGHMKDSLWSIDFFRVESITLKSHWVMVVMDQFSRRIIGFRVHKGALNGTAICCMFNSLINDNPLPKHLSSDNDPLFQFYRWKANLRILDIKEIKSIPYTPSSHPFVERLIKTTRNEFLDLTLFFNSHDLGSKLEKFKHYFNEIRTHSSIDSRTPAQKIKNKVINPISTKDFIWRNYCNELVSLPAAA